MEAVKPTAASSSAAPRAALAVGRGFYAVVHHCHVLEWKANRLCPHAAVFSSCCRMLLDRAHTADPVCPGSDSDPEPGPLAGPPLRRSGTSTSQTNTSDLTGSSHLPCHSPPASSPSSSRTPSDLSQILVNIKSCRWRHFRPRTLPRQPCSGADLARRGLRDFSRAASGLNGTPSGAAGSLGRAGPAPMPPVNGEFAASAAASSAASILGESWLSPHSLFSSSFMHSQVSFSLNF